MLSRKKSGARRLRTKGPGVGVGGMERTQEKPRQNGDNQEAGKQLKEGAEFSINRHLR